MRRRAGTVQLVLGQIWRGGSTGKVRDATGRTELALVELEVLLREQVQRAEVERERAAAHAEGLRRGEHQRPLERVCGAAISGQ